MNGYLILVFIFLLCAASFCMGAAWVSLRDIPGKFKSEGKCHPPKETAAQQTNGLLVEQRIAEIADKVMTDNNWRGNAAWENIIKSVAILTTNAALADPIIRSDKFSASQPESDFRNRGRQ